MKYQISPEIRSKYNLGINAIALTVVILMLNYFAGIFIDMAQTNADNAISEKMSIAQKAQIDNNMVADYVKRYGENAEDILAYSGKLSLIKQIEATATTAGIPDISWSMGAVIKTEPTDYRLSGYQIFETPIRINIYLASKSDINSFIADLAKINSSAIIIRQVIMEEKVGASGDAFSAEIELRIKNYAKI